MVIILLHIVSTAQCITDCILHVLVLLWKRNDYSVKMSQGRQNLNKSSRAQYMHIMSLLYYTDVWYSLKTEFIETTRSIAVVAFFALRVSYAFF